MAHVIGLHLIKGNSNVSHGVKLKAGQTFKEGEAVAIESFDPIVVAKLVAGNKFGGYLCDICKDSGIANLVVASAALPLPAGSGWAVGDAVSVSLTTGMIGTGAVGERGTNGIVVDASTKVIDGKTGIESDGVVIRFGMAEDLGAI